MTIRIPAVGATVHLTHYRTGDAWRGNQQGRDFTASGTVTTSPRDGADHLTIAADRMTFAEGFRLPRGVILSHHHDGSDGTQVTVRIDVLGQWRILPVPDFPARNDDRFSTEAARMIDAARTAARARGLTGLGETSPTYILTEETGAAFGDALARKERFIDQILRQGRKARDLADVITWYPDEHKDPDEQD